MTDTRSAFAADPATPTTGAGWGWIMAYGILSVLFALACFAWPFAATYAATLVIGALFIAAGAVSIGAGIFGRGSESRAYAIGFGILSLVIGLILAFEPYTGALSLTLLVAVWLAVRGVMELVWGSRYRRGRGWMIALGVINILLAIFVIATLGISAMVLPGYILAISFLFGGISAIVAAAHHRTGASAFAVPN